MGPLSGIRVIEMKGIGPGPYAGMLLADLGAEVIVVERSAEHQGIGIPAHLDVNSRGKKSIVLNLKTDAGHSALLDLVETADVLFEGNRPGVAERLGFGPEVCQQRNPRLIYGRLSGWGQSGPLAQTAGHDINYISISGALAAIGGAEKPVPPLNLVGDYAGGSMFLVMGILAALLEAQRSGKGQIIDSAISDGSASLMSMFHGMDAMGSWSTRRETNLLDGGAHFYGVYETLDTKFVSIGPIEPKFYSLLIEKAGLDPELFEQQHDASLWPQLKVRLAEIFKTKTRDEWCSIMRGTDVCFTPVLNYLEAPDHPHNRARGTFVEINGVTQPAVVPRFSRSTCDVPFAPRTAGADTQTVLEELARKS